MKRRSLLENNMEISSVSSAASFSDIVEDNGNAVIVTGYMEFVAGSEKLSMYDTDFDLKEALGNDYFVFYEKLKNRNVQKRKQASDSGRSQGRSSGYAVSADGFSEKNSTSKG